MDPTKNPKSSTMIAAVLSDPSTQNDLPFGFGVGVGPCGNLPCPGASDDFPANGQGLWI